jgi:hypothetical protein
MATIFFYVKFCERRDFAEQFVAGRLHLNTIQFFKDRDRSADGRADRREAASQWHQPGDITIQFAGHTIPSADMVAPVVIQETHHDDTNVLCLYAGTSGTFEKLHAGNIEAFREHMRIPERCFEMGPWAVLIRNVTEFHRRFDAEIRKQRFGLTRGPVTYFDGKTFSGTIERPVFWKCDDFSWQREYRMAVSTNGPPGPIVLDVGDLSDICTVVPSQKLREVTVGLPSDDTQPG